MEEGIPNKGSYTSCMIMCMVSTVFMSFNQVVKCSGGLHAHLCCAAPLLRTFLHPWKVGVNGCENGYLVTIGLANYAPIKFKCCSPGSSPPTKVTICKH